MSGKLSITRVLRLMDASLSLSHHTRRVRTDWHPRPRLPIPPADRRLEREPALDVGASIGCVTFQCEVRP